MQNTMTARPAGARPSATPRPRQSSRTAPRLGFMEIALLVVAAALLLGVFFWQLSAVQTPSIERTATISVSDTDTLWGIAQRHPVAGLTTAETVQIIRSINEMRDSSVVAGQSLLVPALDSSDSSVALR